MDALDCEDNSGLPPFQPAAHSEHTIDDCAVSVKQTPMAGPTKRKFRGSSQGERKKGRARKLRSWRVAWKTFHYQLNHNNASSESIMITHIQRQR
ncbi:unnamed protein product [Camellia sinensis]